MAENSNDYGEFTEIQKMGRSMRIFGFTHIGFILSSFLISFIVSYLVMQNVVIPEGATFEETMVIINAASEELLSQLWAEIYVYVFDAIIIIGLGYFIFYLYQVVKVEQDQNLSVTNYSLIGSLGLSMITFILTIIAGNLENLDVFFWIIFISSIGSGGAAIAGYLFLQRWSIGYEQQMGTGVPLLSNRIRRILLGEILILLGIIITALFGMTSGIFTIIGEIFVGSNLIRSGKLLELDTLPQVPSFPSEQPRTPTNQEYPEFKQPERLIPDEVYYCPSCGAKLESESQDFCIKCGRSIPKSEE